MTRHQFPVFSADGITKVADAYECESTGCAAEPPIVFVRLGTTGLYMAPADAAAFATLILTAVAVADIDCAKDILEQLDEEQS